MKLAVRRTSATIAALATAGVSTLLTGVSPAAAAAPTEACGTDGALIAPGVCELTVTSGPVTFARTPQMTKLEVLLVGAGGMSSDPGTPNTDGYGAAGGGGEVKIVDFSSGITDLDITVADATDVGTVGLSSVDDGTTLTSAANGLDGAGGVGGASGSGFAGASVWGGVSGGGGASASPTAQADGGAGQVVSAIALPGSLFVGDSNCYGGGGSSSDDTVTGNATCGGGAGGVGGTSIAAPLANSGGGAGGVFTSQTAAARTGSDGVAVIRWTAASVTIHFQVTDHGTDPVPQSVVAGYPVTKPADPTADGFTFAGWYTDAALTTPVDFSAAVTSSTTYFARWTPELAATGVELTTVVPLGAGSLLAGALLLAYRRRPRSN